MKVFRLRTIKRLMLFITGITFLNMGFFAAEASMLNLKTKLVQTVASSGFEEEREHETSSQDSVKEIDLLTGFVFTHNTTFVLFAEGRKVIGNDPFANHHHLEIFCPPPEHPAFL